MEYAEHLNITDDDDEYAIGNNVNNEILAEGNVDDDNENTSAARCTESIILSAMPAESMMLSALAESIILSALPAESMILSALPAKSIARLHPER